MGTLNVANGILYSQVYVAKTVPSLQNYDYSDTANSNLHIVTFDMDTDFSTTYQIGIYGNPYSVNYQGGVPFEIVSTS